MTKSQIDALEQAGRELISGQYDPAVWALALESANGNNDAARAAYVRIRVPSLAMVYEQNTKQLEAEQVHQRMRDVAAFQNAQRQERLRREERAKRDADLHVKYRDAGRRVRSFLRGLGL